MRNKVMAKLLTIFIFQSGRRATRAYLHEYIKKQNPEPISPSGVFPDINNSNFNYKGQKQMRHSSSTSTVSSYKSLLSDITPIEIG
jgi:hypothetical protein